MNLYLFSDNGRYLNYWQESLCDAKTVRFQELDSLDETDIVILDYSGYAEGVITKAKVIVLDNEPGFERSMQLYKSGVKAYGNVYMHASHLHSAIESLKENKIWMYPDFIAKIISLSSELQEDTVDKKIAVLTAREKEIAKAIIDGLTNKEIAIKLSISPNTIKVHTKNIYKKLDVTDRLSLYTYLK